MSYGLLKTTGIYFVGNFASKLLVFFLLPLYTACLTPSDYGIVDLLISLVPLIGPVFTLQATESVFRFLFDKKNDQQIAMCISSAFAFMLFGIVLFVVLYLMLNLNSRIQYGNYFVIYFFITYLATFEQQVARGLNKSFEYAVSGVLSTVISAVLNVALIVGAGFHGEALLIASIAGSTAVVIYLLIRTNTLHYLSLSKVSVEEIKSQIAYGLPLIPNQICWWALGLFGKYIVLFCHGAAPTGILAFANIFPNVITVVTQIFFLAWVESAIRSFNKEASGRYYTDAFYAFCPLVLSVAMTLLPLVGIYSSMAISDSYYEGVLYVPLLMFSSVLNCFASFLGSVYTVAKKTTSAFSTTIIAATVNIFLSFALIPPFGLWGYSFASLGCYLVLFLIRIKSIKKLIEFKVSGKKLCIGISLYATSCLLFYFENAALYVIALISFTAISCLWNREFIKQLFSVLRKSLK